MKKLYVIIVLSLCFSACKKESLTESSQISNLAKTETIKFLQKELSTSDFDQLDLSKAKYGKIGTNGFVVFIKDYSDTNRFLIVANTKEKWSTSFVNINIDKLGKSGEFTIQNLNKSSSKKITFKNGKINSHVDEFLSKSLNSNRIKILISGEELPPVTVEGIRYLTNEVFFLNSLYWLLNQDNNYLNVYVDLNFGSQAQYYVDNYSIAYEVEFDDSVERTEIDITKIINCFSAVPDAGATYSATLCADIPVNGKPNVLINGISFNPGHAFLMLTKPNGTNSVTKCFGFYPQSGPKNLATLPVTSAIKNDSEHEYNASITMPNISQSNFNVLIANAEISSMQTYDLDAYNCTNYALDVFNSIRSGNEISVATNPTLGGQVPGGLYNRLNTMKSHGSPEAGNIVIGKFNAPSTTGGCP